MRVLLIDDHSLFRRGLRLLLGEIMTELDVIEADSCAIAAQYSGMPFDLVLVDLMMPGTSGLGSLEAARQLFPHCPVVVVSGEDDPTMIRSAIDRGAAGYIPKSAAPRIIESALRLVLARGVYLPPQALNTPTGSPGGLTARQLDVLRAALKGQPNKLIARDLGISDGTVKSHLSAAFKVLQVRNRTEAVYAAAKLGLRL